LQIRPRDFARTLELLEGSQVQFGKAYGMSYDGGFEELAV